MMRSLYTAASGMMAQQTNIDTISNNLANVQSTGFKKSRVEFEDLLYAHSQDPNTDATAGTQVGLGTRVTATEKQFSQGSLLTTNNPYDVAIQGDGFFAVQTPDGVQYSRDGAFKYDANKGEIVNTDGFSLQTDRGFGLKVPKDCTSIQVSPDGKVSGVNATGDKMELGRIVLTRFLNPAGLRAVGGNLYRETPVAGTKTVGTPGDEKHGFGITVQGSLEKSNINVVEEMINIVQSQRAFEMAQKGVQAADEMMRNTNQMSKG
jgi:flagellar basal-body rod protein FlgG